MQLQEHWDNIYSQVPDMFLGWYEENPEYGLELVRKFSLSNSKVLLAGGGTTRLLPLLMSETDRKLIFSDISRKAIELSQSKLEDPEKVDWIRCDLSESCEPLKDLKVDLWFDRALLHFFHTEEALKAYRNNILKATHPGSRIILGVFEKGTAEVCSGLPTNNYDIHQMDEFLGTAFRREDYFQRSYSMPGGDERMYLWGVYERLS
jgi:SAM-dependent methyltransferase